MKNNHGFSNILIISGVFIVMALGGYFGYMYFNTLQNPSTNQITILESKPSDQQVTVSKPANETDSDNSRYLNPTQINSDLKLSGVFLMTEEKIKKNIFYNDKNELFLEYALPGSQQLAKLINGKWTNIKGWNGYPDCKTFDNAGVPYKKSTIDYECVLDTTGQPLRASTNRNDSIEYCKAKYGSGPYKEAPLEINCKKLMN